MRLSIITFIFNQLLILCILKLVWPITFRDWMPFGIRDHNMTQQHPCLLFSYLRKVSSAAKAAKLSTCSTRPHSFWPGFKSLHWQKYRKTITNTTHGSDISIEISIRFDPVRYVYVIILTRRKILQSIHRAFSAETSEWWQHVCKPHWQVLRCKVGYLMISH